MLDDRRAKRTRDARIARRPGNDFDERKQIDGVERVGDHDLRGFRDSGL